jgi:nitroreductase
VDVESGDRLLTTTRTVRRRLDLGRPVPREIIERAIEVALQAPTAGSTQGWRFVVVTDAAKKQAIADIYRRARAVYHRETPAFLDPVLAPGDIRVGQRARMRAAGDHFAAHLGDVPVLLLGCIEGRVERDSVFAQATLYGSILPAVWSLMLALRARGIGAAWTTDHLIYEAETAALLDIPATVTQAALLAIAYFTGDDFRPAARLPAEEVTYWNTWGSR